MYNSGLCVDCNKITTTEKYRDTGQFVCSTCSRTRHNNDIRSGRIVEIELDMNKIKPSTLLLIKSLIEKDAEEFKNNQICNTNFAV